MATRQYIGARYVPIFDGDWDNTKDYDPLVIVSYQGNSYTSRTFVPHGTAITNETYWALTGNYNAQVEAYRQEVLNLTERFEEVFATPEMYGAKGNGIDDDHDALQSLLDENNNIYFDYNKTYAISSPLRVERGNITIYGNGSTIKMMDSAEDSLYTLSFGKTTETLKNITIYDLIIDSNISRTGVDVASDEGTERFNSTLYFENMDNVRLDNCTFKSIGVWALFIGNQAALPLCDNLIVTNCTFEVNLGHTTKAGVDTSAVYSQAVNVCFENNKFTGTVKNITGIELHNNDNHHIKGNYISTFQAAMILVNEDDLADQSAIVEENIFENVEIGVYLWSENGLDNIKIVNNLISINPYLREIVSPISGGVVTHRSTEGTGEITNLSIEGNTIKQSERITSSTPGYMINIVGILLHGLNSTYTNIVIKNNLIEDMSGYGIAVVAVGSENVEISGNTIINPCYSGDITPNGSYPAAGVRAGGIDTLICANLISTNQSVNYSTFESTNTNMVIDDTLINNGTLRNQFNSSNILMVNADSSGDVDGFDFTDNTVIKESSDRWTIDSLIKITDTTFAGYGVYIRLPFTPTRMQNIPIYVGTSADSYACYLAITANNNTAYILRAPQGFTASLLTQNTQINIHGDIYK